VLMDEFHVAECERVATEVVVRVYLVRGMIHPYLNFML
jgi:hypothetical protein